MHPDDEKIEPVYLKEATEFVDFLFDKGYFHDEVMREDMRRIDSYLGFVIQSRVNSAVKCSELLRQIRERKETKE